jgi:hypothetical protein
VKAEAEKAAFKSAEESAAVRRGLTAVEKGDVRESKPTGDIEAVS